MTCLDCNKKCTVNEKVGIGKLKQSKKKTHWINIHFLRMHSTLSSKHLTLTVADQDLQIRKGGRGGRGGLQKFFSVLRALFWPWPLPWTRHCNKLATFSAIESPTIPRYGGNVGHDDEYGCAHAYGTGHTAEVTGEKCLIGRYQPT